MTRSTLAALVVTVALASPAFAEPYLQAEPQHFELQGARRIRIEYPVGRMTLEGDDGTTVRVLVRVDCKDEDEDDCHDDARRIRIDHDVRGDTFVLEFTGIRKNSAGRHATVETHVLAPRALALTMNMGVGDADVDGFSGDLDLELGVGKLDVRAREADYRDAEAESGVGDASIETRSGHVRERGFISHSAHWSDGRGASFVRAHVGVGEANVELR